MHHVTLIVIGIITCIFGILFHLQGQAVVGPEASFMYASSEWENYGIQIAIVGAIIIVAGVIVRLKNKQTKNPP